MTIFCILACILVFIIAVVAIIAMIAGSGKQKAEKDDDSERKKEKTKKVKPKSQDTNSDEEELDDDFEGDDDEYVLPDQTIYEMIEQQQKAEERAQIAEEEAKNLKAELMTTTQAWLEEIEAREATEVDLEDLRESWFNESKAQNEKLKAMEEARHKDVATINKLQTQIDEEKQKRSEASRKAAETRRRNKKATK